LTVSQIPLNRKLGWGRGSQDFAIPEETVDYHLLAFLIFFLYHKDFLKNKKNKKIVKQKKNKKKQENKKKKR